MAASDYSIITSPGFPRGGQWEAKTPDSVLTVTFKLYTTGVIMRGNVAYPGGEKVISSYLGELSAGEFTFMGFIMSLRKDDDGWIYGLVRYLDRDLTPFAFAGFYDGEEGNRPRALSRLHAFLLDNEITTEKLDMGQDDPAAVAAHAERATKRDLLQAIAATAEVIERRASELREAIAGLESSS